MRPRQLRDLLVGSSTFAGLADAFLEIFAFQLDKKTLFDFVQFRSETFDGKHDPLQWKRIVNDVCLSSATFRQSQQRERNETHAPKRGSGAGEKMQQSAR
jgi:hypothetical protein